MPKSLGNKAAPRSGEPAPGTPLAAAWAECWRLRAARFLRLVAAPDRSESNPAPTGGGAFPLLTPDRLGKREGMKQYAVCLLAFLLGSLSPFGAERPNILWLTCEDIGPQLGCYGDAYATTPNLDALARKGTIYRAAWSCAPVCAPARTAIISGIHSPSTGAQHMRSLVPMPPGFAMYPQLLRQAGYYCANNSKEDYNLIKPGRVWDESSRRAHWKNRKPGQPFFAIFNFTVTHESQIRKRPHKWVHDPAKVRVPAYHPDTPEVRKDWAQYYDQITLMDAQAGERLRELEEAGLADDTIVFFYGDHGSGMPRCKRFPYNSGLQVPLIVYIPPKFRDLAPPDYQAGGASARLVSFVDLAPTLLSLAGVEPPAWMQGKAFLGPYATPPAQYIYGFRGRMDERIDMMRSIRDGRFVYIRNYMPHKIYGQHVAYMFQTPTTQVWKKLHDEGKLTPEQDRFWQRKPPEELYDLSRDPDEVHNLAGDPRYAAALGRMRAALREHLLATRDLGFLPEDELHRRAGEDAPYVMGHDSERYPMARIMEMADAASFLRMEALPKLLSGFQDPDPAVRYWAAMGLLMRGEKAVAEGGDQLRRALADPAPSVRIAAAEALGRYGNEKDAKAALKTLLDLASMDKSGVYAAVEALNAIGAVGDRARPALPRLKELPTKKPGLPSRLRNYVPRLLGDLLSRQ